MVIQQDKPQRPVDATPPVFERPPSIGQFSEGEDALLECKVSGKPQPEVKWKRRGRFLQNDHKYKIAYKPQTGVYSLTISRMTADDDGEYTCIASNCAGETSLIASIQRGPSPQSSIQREQSITSTFSQKSVSTESHGTQEYGLQKQSTIQYFGREKTFKIDTFEYRLLHDAEFRQTITKRTSQEEEYNRSIAPDPNRPQAVPQITEKPKNTKRLEGEGMTFQVNLIGNPVPRIIWFRNGIRVSQSQRCQLTFKDNIATLSIRTLLPEDSGYYTLFAENNNGCALCSMYLDIVRYQKSSTIDTNIDYNYGKTAYETNYESSDGVTLIGIKPSFFMIPYDQESIEGKLVRFDCRVGGRPVPEVNWYRDGKLILDDDRFKSVVNEGGIHALMIMAVYPCDAGTYTCVATNRIGDATFSVGLKVVEKEQTVSPKFVERFQTMNVKEGEPVSLYCRAVGTPLPRITWQKDGVQIYSRLPDLDIKTSEGASTLLLNKVTSSHSGWYQCTAQNQAGTAATRAKLYVEAEKRVLTGEPLKLNLPKTHRIIEPEGPQPYETIYLKHVERTYQEIPRHEEKSPSPQKPAFTTHLRDLVLTEGERAHFDARIVPLADPTMKVEWFLNGTLIESSSRVLTTLRFGYLALTIIHVYPEDSGIITCKATNEWGEAITTATLKCNPKTSITKKPKLEESIERFQNVEDWEFYKREEEIEETISVSKPTFVRPLTCLEETMEGGNAHFEAQVTPVNDSTLRIEWYFNGQQLISGTRVSTVFSFGYISLNISQIRPSDSGLYMVKATNAKGEAVSTASLKVKTQNALKQDLIEQQKWQKTQTIQTQQTYEKKETKYEFTDLQLEPQMKPVFKNHIKDQLDVHEGRSILFEASLEPQGDSTMRVEWFKDDKPLKAGSRITSFFNFGYVSLTIKDIDTRDAGIYTCVAKNSLGTAKTGARLTCKRIIESRDSESWQKIRHIEDSAFYKREEFEETIIVQKPTFTTALSGKTEYIEGQSAHFEARLEPLGDPKMRVEWYLNGRELPVGHRFKTYFDFGFIALDVLNLLPEDSGKLEVIAKNSIGKSTLSTDIRVKAKQTIDTSSIYDTTSINRIRRLEEDHYKETDYYMEEITQMKPIFRIPLQVPPLLYNEGESVHMESFVEPVNDPALTLEWFFNGRPLMIGHRYQTRFDFGCLSLDVLSVRTEDTGEYTVRATNRLGSAQTSASITVISQSNVVTESEYSQSLVQIQYLEDRNRIKRDVDMEVIDSKPPIFIKSLHNVETIEETNVHLECRIGPSGDSSMTIEWFKNGQPITVGHRFRPQFDFDFVALDILCVYPEDSGLYTCKAKNKFGEAVSSCNLICHGKSQRVIYETEHTESLINIKHLEERNRKYERQLFIEEEIKIKPRFLTQLKKVELNEGQAAHLECRIEPVNDINLKVEWFHNGKPLPIGHRFQPFYDFGYVALKILQIVPEDSGTYTCRITNNCGSAEISTTILCHGRASIDMGSQYPEGYKKVQYLEERGYYTRNTYEDEIIKQAPVFTTAPRNAEVKEGDKVHFECQLTPIGDPTLTIEWLKNGRPLLQGSRFVEIFDFGFVALDILYAYPEDSGRYTIRATNAYGEASTQAMLKCHGTSSLITTTQIEGSMTSIQRLEHKREKTVYEEELIAEAPVFTHPMKNLSLIENQSAHFETRLIPVGDPNMRVEWFHNGSPLLQANRISTLNDFGYVALDLKYVKPSDSGTFTCKATNLLGQAACSATLHVEDTKSIILDSSLPESVQKISYLEGRTYYRKEEYSETASDKKPFFVTPLKGPNLLEEGKSAHFEGRVEPFPDETMTVEWLHNGRPLTVGNRYRTLFDFGFVALDIMSLIPEDSGEYTIRATNHLGSAESSAPLKVVGRGSIILDSQQPSSLSKIHALEHPHRRKKVDSDTIMIEKPEFGRSLNNIENLKEGQAFHLEATLTPANDPTMKVEWLVDGRPLQTGHRFKSLHDFGFVALDVLYAYPEDSGVYMCKATNGVGEAVTTCSIKVSGRKVIDTDTIHEESLQKITELERPHMRRKESPPPQNTRPVFTKSLKNLEKLKEGQAAHLECRLEPINDPTMRVEWFVNGIAIQTGHRFRMTNDFGYIALDILYTFPEDSGTYMIRATNELGEAVTTCVVSVQGRRSIIYDTHHPEGLEKIQQLESQTNRGREEIEERPPTKPVFLSELRGTTRLVEGERAHFECRVEPSYDPDLNIEFLHNGNPLIAGSRYHTFCDFGYVALDIAYVYPEDAGTYTVKASNRLGEVVSSIKITVEGRKSIQTDSMHSTALPKLHALEGEYRYTRQEQEIHTFQRPIFTTPLHNIDNLLEGDSAHFECRLIPVGDPTLDVEWLFNNTPLKTGSRFLTTNDFGYVALDITYVQPEDSGVYMIRATNELGDAVTTATMQVKSKAAIQRESQHPEGLQQIQALESSKLRRLRPEPENIYNKPVFTTPLIGPKELVEGEPAHFECRAIPVGDPDLDFIWYLNGVELQTGSRFATSHDFGYISLDIAATCPEDSGVYMIKAMNRSGESITSSSLKVKGLSVINTECQHPEAFRQTQRFEMDTRRVEAEDQEKFDRPVFTQHLSSLEKLKEGQYVYLEARVEPANDDKLIIEWHKNSQYLVLGSRITTRFDFGAISLEIMDLKAEDSGIYTCRAVNQSGEAISTCTIKVQGVENLELRSLHPESWQKIQQLEAYKPTKQEIEKIENEIPYFVSHMNNLDLKEGDAAHFECRIEPSRDPSMKFEMLHNGKPMPTGSRYSVTHDFGYISVDIAYAYPEDSGVYTCRAANSKGQALSTASLKVQGKGPIDTTTLHPMGQQGLERIQELEMDGRARPPQEEKQEFSKPYFVEPLNPNFTVNESEGLHLECRVEPSNDPKLTIEWYCNGQPLTSGSRFATSSDFGYIVMDIHDLWPRDNGVYTCRASNEAGEAFTTTQINIIAKSGVLDQTLHPDGQKGLEKIQQLEEQKPKEAPIVTEQLHAPQLTLKSNQMINLKSGESAHIEASLIPVGDSDMTIEWFFNELPLKASHRIHTICSFGFIVLEIFDVRGEDTGTYTCVATNDYGTSQMSIQIECKDTERGQRPHFTTQMANVFDLREGESTHFECLLEPVGDSTMKVEWYHNGQPLRPSSRIKLMSDFGYVVMDISFVHCEDSGEYVCVATNKYGSDTTRYTIKCSPSKKIVRETMHPKSMEQITALEGYTGYPTPIEITSTASEAPKFLSQIQPVTNLIEGQSAHFETQLNPIYDPDLTVEWNLNGKPLIAGNRFRTFHDFGIVVLDILQCDEDDSGVYECKATNKLGTDTTTATLECKSKGKVIRESQLPQEMSKGIENLILLEESMTRKQTEYSEEVVFESPRFEAPLENVTNLKEGEGLHIETRVTPNNDPNLSVEWLKNSKPLRASNRIRTISDFGFIVLEINPIYAEDSGIYSVRATNDSGEAVMTCSIKCQGSRKVVLESQLPKGMETTIEKLSHFEETVERQVSESWTETEERQAPKFLNKLNDLSINENDFTHFECRLIPVSDPTMRVEWFVNGKPLVTGSRFRTISDFGYVVLEITEAYPRDSGLYECKAINSYGQDSVSCRLSVKSQKTVVLDPQLPREFISSNESIQRLEDSLNQRPEVIEETETVEVPKFLTQIQDLLDKVEGDSAHFECRLQPIGDPTLTVEWYLNDKPLVTGSRIHTVDDFGFVVLEIDWLFPRDSGVYKCVATNKWGSDSTQAIIKVKAKKGIILDSQLPPGMSSESLKDLEYPLIHKPTSEDVSLQAPRFVTHIKPLQNLVEGDNIHFECRLEPTTDGQLTVDWYHNGEPLRSGHRHKTIHDFGFVSLDIIYVYPEDSGEYVCHAKSPQGEDTTRALVRVSGRPTLDYTSQLPKEMSGAVDKIVEMEASWQRVESEEVEEKKKTPPEFVLQPEPLVVLEGDCAKFCCRLVGNPKPRVIWIINGSTVVQGSRYKLRYDGMHHLDIPKSRQYDKGKIEVYAKNAVGEAYSFTSLDVRPRNDDYRAVLKHSPKPWYDDNVGKYQLERQTSELEKVFEERVTPGGGEEVIWYTEQTNNEGRVKIREKVIDDITIQSDATVCMQDKGLIPEPEDKSEKPKKIFIKSQTKVKEVDDSYPIAPTVQEKPGEKQKPVKTEKKVSETKLAVIEREAPTSPESVVHGKEVIVQTQKQTQKEQKGDLEITRHIRETETIDQEHKSMTKERKVIGKVAEVKPPTFTLKIQPCRTYEKKGAKFQCTFTGVPTPTITWFRENFPIQSSEDLKITTTETTSTLVITEVFTEDSGVFSVKAENSGGSAKCSANLIVEEVREVSSGLIPPSFIKTIQCVSTKVGQIIRLEAKISGSKPLNVYWVKNGNRVSQNTKHKIIEDDDQYTLLVLEVDINDQGSYECAAINKAGEARCTCQVLVEAPLVTRQLSKEEMIPKVIEKLKDITVKEGQSAVFRCRISGTEEYEVIWLREGEQIKQSRYFRMTEDGEYHTLRISEAFAEDEGMYKCVAGTVSTSAKLRVIEETETSPILTPLEDLTVMEGSPARFVTALSGSPTPKITWYRDGKVIEPTRDFQMSQDHASCSLVIRQTYPEDEGIYECIAVTPIGQIDTSARLTVESKEK